MSTEGIPLPKTFNQVTVYDSMVAFVYDRYTHIPVEFYE